MLKKLPKVLCLNCESDIFIRKSKVCNLYYIEKDEQLYGFIKKVGKAWMLSFKNQVLWFEFLSELFKFIGGHL